MIAEGKKELISLLLRVWYRVEGDERVQGEIKQISTGKSIRFMGLDKLPGLVQVILKEIEAGPEAEVGRVETNKED